MNWGFLAVSAAILWGFQYASYGAKLASIPATVFGFYYYLGVMFVNTLIVLSVNPVSELVIPRHQVGWLLGQVLVGAVASLFIAKSIQAQNASMASMVEIAYPLFVIGFGVLFFKQELPTMRQLAGGCITLFGVLLILK